MHTFTWLATLSSVQSRSLDQRAQTAQYIAISHSKSRDHQIKAAAGVGWWAVDHRAHRQFQPKLKRWRGRFTLYVMVCYSVIMWFTLRCMEGCIVCCYPQTPNLIHRLLRSNFLVSTLVQRWCRHLLIFLRKQNGRRYRQVPYSSGCLTHGHA